MCVYIVFTLIYNTIQQVNQLRLITHMARSTKEIIKQTILDVAEKKKKFQAPDISAALREKVTRQYVTMSIKELVDSGQLLREGGGRYTFYALPQYAEYLDGRVNLRRVLTNQGLKEHEVLDSLERQSVLLRSMEDNVSSIFTYAFSEMLNNAIDHSESRQVEVTVSHIDNHLRFVVEDFGVGVFRNVMKKKNLNNELEAITELLKGKTTTAPQAHSGEGIFFTSKIADVFVLDSYKYRLRVDNNIPDIFIEELDAEVEGTRVEFWLSLETAKHLNDVFAKYQTNSGEFAFDKTEILVKLYTMGTIYVSRSQARRIMDGLDRKFKVIVLDFDKVPTVGQAFSDEIFRVFKLKNPDIEVKAVNMNEAVEFMIGRVAQE